MTGLGRGRCDICVRYVFTQIQKLSVLYSPALNKRQRSFTMAENKMSQDSQMPINIHLKI